MKRLNRCQIQIINSLLKDIDLGRQGYDFRNCCGVHELGAGLFYNCFRDFHEDIISLAIKNLAVKVAKHKNIPNIFVFTVSTGENTKECINFITNNATSKVNLGSNKFTGNKLTLCVWDMKKIAEREIV